MPLLNRGLLEQAGLARPAVKQSHHELARTIPGIEAAFCSYVRHALNARRRSSLVYYFIAKLIPE